MLLPVLVFSSLIGHDRSSTSVASGVCNGDPHILPRRRRLLSGLEGVSQFVP